MTTNDTKDITKAWLEQLNNNIVPDCVVDEDGIFDANSDIGLKPGNYLAKTELVERKNTFAAYTGQTGCDKNPSRCL